MVIAGIAILIVITLMNNGDKHAGETLTLSTGLIIKYFIAGMCASSAMLLPGISGSFMLLVFGVYGTVMLAISEVVKLNFGSSYITCSRIWRACWIHYFKQNYPVFPNTS